MDYITLIDYWPDVSALAKDMGEKPDTVRKWRERNSVPSDKWLRFVNAAKKRGYKVTFEILSSIASKASENKVAVNS